MIRNTCLINEGSPILAGIAVAATEPLPPAAFLMFSARSQWLFNATCLVNSDRKKLSGIGTMLTVPRSWWVLRAVAPNSVRQELDVVGAPGTVAPIVGFAGPGGLQVDGLPVVPQPLSLATISALSTESYTTEAG